MPTSKNIIFLSILSLLILGAGCGEQKPDPQTTTTTSTPTIVIKQPIKPDDPAEDFCKNNGHELIVRFDQETQSSKSFCRFSDMTECSVRDLYQGTCSPGQDLVNKADSTEAVNIFAVCETTYKPVCGQDKLTYTNSCLAQIQGIIISHEGVCTEGQTTFSLNGASKSATSQTETNTEAEPFSELPPTIDTSMPAWMSVVKDFVLSSPPNNPRAFIEKCSIGGNIYYFQSDGCTDCFSTLYNENGNAICYPSNDLGNECPGSFTNKYRPGCARIWTDNR
ncbi:MAG: Kazal-type serine protease inhibitor [Candidatus Magasanikbacteria bacterium]